MTLLFRTVQQCQTQISKRILRSALSTKTSSEMGGVPPGIEILYGDESLAHELREFTREEKQERAMRLRSKKVRPILREKKGTHELKDWQKIFEEDFEDGEEMEIVPLPPLVDEHGNVPIDPKLESIYERIIKLNLLEVSQVVAFCEARLAVRGIEINARNPLGQGGSAGKGGTKGSGSTAAAEAPKEEKTSFEVKLTGFDAKSKIKVIKEIRAITGLGLKEAKELVEGAPKSVKANVKKEEAEQLREALEAVGATVEIE